MPMEVRLVSVVALIVLVLLMMLLRRYKKCPSDKVMVIYGSVGQTPTARIALQSAYMVARRLCCRSYSRMRFWT